MTDSAVNRSVQGCGRILTHVSAEDINLYKKAEQCPYIQVTIKKKYMYQSKGTSGTHGNKGNSEQI